ncbi:TetR family transcriptional regulator [Arthrobacter alpinus]|uniref:TetR family transcriptional regulator n=2 Tax=Arthrobacter TaxID=1663 RepID=UPI000784F8D5|nr:TetR family transcriptional regulator [Arthrobacter alpinus]
MNITQEFGEDVPTDRLSSMPNVQSEKPRRKSPSRVTSVNTRDAIVAAAVSAFYDNGYHGTAIREIASRADLSLSALYHYFASKQELLAGIIDGFMVESVRVIDAAVQSAGADPGARLRAAARTQVHRNATNIALSFITNSEIRSLEGANQLRHIGHRDQIQALFDDAVMDGRKQRLFDVTYPKEASRAIVTMCTAVATWYRPTGPLTPDEVADRYGEYALNLVNAS